MFLCDRMFPAPCSSPIRPATRGGELVIYLGTEIVHIKGNAGSAVFYASTHVHQVEPVRSGSRLVMITFIESQIPTHCNAICSTRIEGDGATHDPVYLLGLYLREWL
jgi:hypothetical protein